ncbi:MAG: hypothetical protein RSC76_07670 [Oscillospiraceae bacterium]
MQTTGRTEELAISYQNYLQSQGDIDLKSFCHEHNYQYERVKSWLQIRGISINSLRRAACEKHGLTQKKAARTARFIAMELEPKIRPQATTTTLCDLEIKMPVGATIHIPRMSIENLKELLC